MKRQTTLVFDEQIMSTGPDDYFTSAEHNARLGAYDQLAIHVVVDNPNAADGALTVQLQHSADGRHFLPKPVPPAPATPEINGAEIKAKSTSQAWGYDSGAIPSLAYVRLRVAVTAPAVGSRVRIYATSRDHAG